MRERHLREVGLRREVERERERERERWLMTGRARRGKGTKLGEGERD